jgi:hypothetical protein
MPKLNGLKCSTLLWKSYPAIKRSSTSHINAKLISSDSSPSTNSMTSSALSSHPYTSPYPSLMRPFTLSASSVSQFISTISTYADVSWLRWGGTGCHPIHGGRRPLVYLCQDLEYCWRVPCPSKICRASLLRCFGRYLGPRWCVWIIPRRTVRSSCG